MLAMASLSANILRYRSEKGPTAKIVDKIQNKVAKLQKNDLVTQEAIAKLCIRMSEGCIDETEANRLVSMPTSEFVEYIEHIRTSENAYFEKEEENENLRSEIDSLNKINKIKDAKLKMKDMQLHSFLYILFAIIIYIIYWFLIRKQILNEWLDFAVQTIYWIITCVLMNFIDHGKIWLGVKSFIRPNSVIKKIVEDKEKAL